MNIPKDLRYTAEHEWIRVEGDLLVLGITDFAQSELSDIVYVEVDVFDEELDAGAQFGTVEAVKTVSDLFMPVKGTVLELNEALSDEPELVNSDAYGAGWMVKIKASDVADVESLMDAEAYQAHLGV